MDKLKIEYVGIEELKTYENNAKIHTAEQVEQIKKSIEEFGFNDPLAVWKNNTIVEGHGRYIAAVELGIKTIPIIRIDGLTDEQRRAYGIIHNQLTMNTGFDFDLLQMELEKVGGDYDMKAFGFEDVNIEEPDYVIENREYSTDEFDDERFEYECPERGFRFNA